MNSCPEPSPLHHPKGHAKQGRCGSTCTVAPSSGAQLWWHHLLSLPALRMPLPLEPPQLHDSSNCTSMAWATLRWKDCLTAFPGLSSSQTQGGHFYTHSNNIPTSLSCFASSMVQSLQENFPPKICDLLMEAMKATTRGQSKSCLAKVL